MFADGDDYRYMKLATVSVLTPERRLQDTLHKLAVGTQVA